MEQRTITILDPVSLPKTKSLTFNSRLKSVAGMTVAMIDNTKPNFSIFCDRVEELLVSQYGAKVVRYRKPGRTAPLAQNIIDEIKMNCNFAITGLGD